MKIISRALAFGVLVCGVAAGCSNNEVKKQTIEGTISYNGVPLQSGILRLVGTGGAFATAPIRADGTFTVTDVAPGEVQVGITEAPHSASSSDGKGVRAAKKPVPLPAKFKNPEQSGVKYTIGEDTRKLDIELK